MPKNIDSDLLKISNREKDFGKITWWRRQEINENESCVHLPFVIEGAWLARTENVK